MPDFIIIGAMKCATSTLHEQLARQPGIFMSMPKEPYFFSNDEVWARGIDWYASLFAQAPTHALCGESSTHYTKLPTYPLTVHRMTKRLKTDTRFIYIMRHPIDRLISQYIHEWTQCVISSPIDQAIHQHPELIDYSCYAMQLEPYFEAYGQENVLPVFFDRLSSEPQPELERVCRFIGYDGSPQWDAGVEGQNVSSQRMRASPLRDAIINLPGLKTLRRRLVPKPWRERVKTLWMMKQRPQLSDTNRDRLRAIFDKDLSLLGTWLGIDLSCENFKRVAKHSAPEWCVESRAAAP
ncbi:MAG: sulfotransferase domain-containing protein [Phycisphaerales bacterium]|nr:sulfotransferase domain-containing protein [Phycisphaerales bacterium]